MADAINTVPESIYQDVSDIHNSDLMEHCAKTIREISCFATP